MAGSSNGARLCWNSSAYSVRGNDRAVNEDALLVKSEAGLFLVSDGMGGHCDGWLASRTIAELLRRTIDPVSPFAERFGRATMALRAANAILFEEGQLREPPVIVGSTVVAGLVDEWTFSLLWAGDSRAYLWRAQQLTQLTEDHTVAVEISPTARNPQALTRAVGAAAECSFARRDVALREGDLILLCTDGLTKVVTDGELAELFRKAPMVDAEWLVARALANGARDDVTAITVRFRVNPAWS